MNYPGLTFRAWLFTCAVDGLEHFVSDVGPEAGRPAVGITGGRSGFYLALCGHQIQVGALVSPPGPLCPRCAQLVKQIRATSGVPDRPPRGGRLRRLLNDLWLGETQR